MNNISQDINTFSIGTYVDIPGIDKMQNIRIEKINDSGVTVSGAEIGNYLVISGKSPATRCEKQERMRVVKPKIEEVAEETSTVEEKLIEKVVERQRKSSGSYDTILSSMEVPAGNFTIKQIAELNKLPIPYATAWIKENCEEAGKAEKKEGQRGKPAMLYKIKE